MRQQRGFTAVSAAFLLAAIAFGYCVYTFGPAWWEHFEVKQILTEAANYSFHHRAEGEIRDFIDRRMHQRFDTGEYDAHGNQVMSVDYDVRRDVRIEFTDAPPQVDLWFTYNRHVPLPLIGGEKVVAFDLHVDEDLSPVKW